MEMITILMSQVMRFLLQMTFVLKYGFLEVHIFLFINIRDDFSTQFNLTSLGSFQIIKLFSHVIALLIVETEISF